MQKVIVILSLLVSFSSFAGDCYIEYVKSNGIFEVSNFSKIKTEVVDVTLYRGCPLAISNIENSKRIKVMRLGTVIPERADGLACRYKHDELDSDTYVSCLRD